MTGGFVQLFSLCDDLIRSLVISSLSWKDLARLEEATGNQMLHGRFRGWIRNVTLDWNITSASYPLFLDWVSRRECKIDCLHVGRQVDSAKVAQIKSTARSVHVNKFHQMFCHSVSGCATTDLLQTLTNLREIEIYTKQDIGTLEAWKLVFEQNPNIEVLDVALYEQPIDNLYVELIAANCKRLKHLTLSRCTGVGDSSVVLLAQQCLQLTHLTLEDCKELTDATLQAVGTHCTNLQYLCLQAAAGTVTDTGLVHLLQRCLYISTLQLWDCSLITGVSFAALLPFCVQLTNLGLRKCTAFYTMEAHLTMTKLIHLERIDLSLCTNISEKMLLLLVENNPRLSRVYLKDIATVTDTVVATIAQSCKRLRCLNVAGCSQVTDLLPLQQCANLCHIVVERCGGVLDATLLALAATPGSTLTVFGSGSGITTQALDSLQGSTRIDLDLMISGL